MISSIVCPPHASTVSRFRDPDKSQLSENAPDPPIVTSATRDVARGAVMRSNWMLVADEERPDRLTFVVDLEVDPS